MYNILGFDIGTTEIKCTLYLVSGMKYFWRISTPKVDISIGHSEEVTFSPSAIWKVVKEQIEKINLNSPKEQILISIASQAPSLCYWNDEGYAVGVSYLSYYGDPKINLKRDRQYKAVKRIQLANSLFLQYGRGKVSGITGYIVYQLSGQLTIDAVTAWELGIESFQDIGIIKEEIGIHEFPEIVPPVKKYSIKNTFFENGVVIAGTTDSAILPISIFPEFPDYYVYLGTWGSLLKSQILEWKDYYRTYHQGNLHSWIISIEDFIYKVDNNSLFLNNMFEQISNEVEPYSRIAVCGGLVLKMKDTIKRLANCYLPTQDVIFTASEHEMVGACRLGIIAMEENIIEKST